SSQSKDYGALDPALTYTNSPALVSGDSFSGALDRAAGENVGSYAIGLGTLSAGSNYDLSLAAAPVTFAITKKPVTVTPDSDQGKVYGSLDPTLSYTNSPALVSGDSFTGELARAAGENVGSYAINLGTLSAGTNDALSLSATPVTFAITKKPVTITPDAGQSKVYGTSDPALTFTNNVGLVGAD